VDPGPTPRAVPFAVHAGKRNSRGDDGRLGAVLAGGQGSRLGGAKPTADLAGRPLISYPLAALAAAGIEPFVVAKHSTDLRGRPMDRQTDLRTTALGVPDERTTAVGVPDQKAPAAGAPDERPPPAPGVPDLWTTAAGAPGQGRTPPRAPDERTTAPALGGVEIVTEPDEPTHPLAGIVAALRHAGRPLVVVGCDFPFAPPALLRALAEAPEPLAVPAPGGEPQPLMARWSPELLPRLEIALEREESLRRTVAALSPRLLDDTELAQFGDPARAFFNVNTPADLSAAAALL